MKATTLLILITIFSTIVTPAFAQTSIVDSDPIFCCHDARRKTGPSLREVFLARDESKHLEFTCDLRT